MKKQVGRIFSLDGGTEALMHEDGRVYLTGYGAPSYTKELPRIYLSAEDAHWLALQIILHSPITGGST